MSRVSFVRAIFALTALVAVDAGAGNDDEFLVGNQAAMVGGAVLASASDGSATYYNPAGIAGIARNRIDVGGSVYTLRFHKAVDYVRSTEGSARDGTVREFVAVPTQVAFARRITDDVSVGLGYFVPRTSNIVLRERLDETIGNVSTQYSVNTIQVNSEFVVGAVLGWEVAPNLRLGGGLLGTYDDVTDSASLFAAVRSGGIVQKSFQVDLLRTQTIVALAPTVGVHVDVSDELTVAAAVRAPRLSVFDQGLIRLDATVGSDDGAVPPVVDATTETLRIDGTPLEAVNLGRYLLGFAYRVGDTQLTADGDWQPALTNDSANVRRRAAFNVRAGVFHQATPRVGLGAGVFTDTETEGFDPDAIFSIRGDFYGATVGLRVSNEHDLEPDEPADTLVFTSVFAFKYAFSAGDGISLVFDRTAPAAGMITGGESSATVHELSLHVGSGVYF